MSSIPGGPSPFTKMRQVYWEAKNSFIKSLGQSEDSCIISSDSELDIRLELLQNADNYFNALMKVMLEYRDSLQNVVNTQENLGLALIEYGTKDFTAAGKVMCMSGKAISKAAHRQSQLKTYLMNLFHEVQTFQFNATADALQTVAKMEKVRKSYRSGLMWLKNESTDLDPDVNRKIRNFRKVQEHIKRLKVRFDGVKLESMQKIDLFLLSRSNLFSHTLVPYSKAFKKMSKQSVLLMDYTLKNIPVCLSYNFVALKELNQYSKTLQSTLQPQPSAEQTFRKQKKSKSQVGKLKSAFISDEQSNMFPPSSCSSTSKVATADEFEPLEENVHSPSTLLIDFDEERENQFATILPKKNIPTEINKYSEDLLSINFDDCRPSYDSEFSMRNFIDASQNSLTDFPLSQVNLNKECGDLHFWSLIQSHERTSKLLEMDNPNMDSELMHPKQSLITSSDSKWNDVLVQFDPFLDEISKHNNEAECLELC